MLIVSFATMLVNVLHVFSVTTLIQFPIFVSKNLHALFQIVSVALLLMDLHAWRATNTSLFQGILLHALHLLLAPMERYLMERLALALKESMILGQLVLIALVIA